MLELPFPSRFSVQVNAMRDGRRLSAAALADAVRQPLDSKPLRELAARGRTAVIAVDDITRPTPVADVLPALLSELQDIPAENIKFLVALGAHRPMVRAELEKKLGTAVLDMIGIPGVNEVAVIGLSDEKWGEIACAIVVADQNEVSEQQIVEFCGTRLARYKLPKKVIFAEEIPRNPSGKILKRVLREKYV